MRWGEKVIAPAGFISQDPDPQLGPFSLTKVHIWRGGQNSIYCSLNSFTHPLIHPFSVQRHLWGPAVC